MEKQSPELKRDECVIEFGDGKSAGFGQAKIKSVTSDAGIGMQNGATTITHTGGAWRSDMYI